MNWNLKQYLSYALMIVRTNTIVLWWIGCIGILSGVSLLLRDSSLFWPLNVVITILSIVSTPIIYGIYFELIEDTYTSIPQIAKTYIPGYLWLIVRMYLPPIFLASMLVSLTSGSSGGGVLEITLVLFSLIYLFVIPSYYIIGTGRGSISQGVIYLSKNLVKATPIILTVLLLESSMLLVQYQRSVFSVEDGIVFVILDFLIYFCASVADYIVFIILIFVLKEHPAVPIEDSDQ